MQSRKRTHGISETRYMYLFFPVSNNETLTATEGNPFRDVWKAACWKMSQEVFQRLNELYHILYSDI